MAWYAATHYMRTAPAAGAARSPPVAFEGGQRVPYTAARFSRQPNLAHARVCKEPSMPRFTGVDFYEIDSLLTEEEIQIRDHVREGVGGRYLPLIRHASEEARLPAELIPDTPGQGPPGDTHP